MMRRAQPWLGTLVEITAAGDPAAGDPAAGDPAAGAPAAGVTAAGAIDAAFAEVALVHRLMSFHDAGSDVSRLNGAETGALLTVHPHTWQVLQLAQQIADQSDHIFNIACAPRLVEWSCLPSPTGPAVAPTYHPGRAVLRCDEGRQVRKMAPGWIDLGGIAKGYAVDLAIEALQRAGVSSACVNAGGDLRVIGPAAWPVAIRAPRAPGRSGATLQLRGAALATSARYFSARQHAGHAVCALVDGRDGAAIASGASVTVQAGRCAVADALTKVVLASGDAGHPALAAFGATAFII